MPLSPPAARQPLHTRRVTCQGYEREDGLWDIEGHITDEKAYPFANEWRGTIEPGQFLHEMWIRLTVDDTLTVRAVDVATDNSPFAHCPAILDNFQRLVGLSIAAGWTRAVRQRLGGTEGCTHLVELLGPVATTAFQTLAPRLNAKRNGGDGTNRPPPVLNTCHVMASDGPVVRRWFPEHYDGPEGVA
ncbi:MAG: DUF2889 domain-containing protein [Azospirillaceae bacterium]|nr:DUF2889 domain-containing protein [Azospirillaceae bacterium]